MVNHTESNVISVVIYDKLRNNPKSVDLFNVNQKGVNMDGVNGINGFEEMDGMEEIEEMEEVFIMQEAMEMEEVVEIEEVEEMEEARVVREVPIVREVPVVQVVQVMEDNVSMNANASSDSDQDSIVDEFFLMDQLNNATTEAEIQQIRSLTYDYMNSTNKVIPPVTSIPFITKHQENAPYYMFYNSVLHSQKPYYKYSLSFPEILCSSLGKIVSSLFINNTVDIGYILLMYCMAGQKGDFTIMAQRRTDTKPLPNNINYTEINMVNVNGNHNSKLIVLKYADNGIRLIVLTANIVAEDWENRLQGIWVSPYLTQLPQGMNSYGDSVTGFRHDLLEYLYLYENPFLSEWVHTIGRADFTAVKLFLITSFPGNFNDSNDWGHMKLRNILARHAVLPKNSKGWSIVAQSNSINYLGNKYHKWLMRNIVASMAMDSRTVRSHPRFILVYPSISNFNYSYDFDQAKCGMSYSITVHSKQDWLSKFMYQWKSLYHESYKAMPQVSTYMRLAPNCTSIAWFVLTSADLSKSAWGTLLKDSFYMDNYELGIVFLPKIICRKPEFPIHVFNKTNLPLFPIPYELPFTRYHSNDSPFVLEYIYA